MLPDDLRSLLGPIASAGESFVPLDALRSAVSILAASRSMKPSLDITLDELRDDAMVVCASIPTLIMALYRLRQGLEPIEPHPDLGYAANYLYMLTGEEPDPASARGVEQYQISGDDRW